MGRLGASVNLFIWLVLLAFAGQAESWKLQYFYDQDKETLVLNDLKCVTAKRCVASGQIEGEKNSNRPTAVVTSDGGAHWALVPLKETPISLFFLDENTGWMVGNKNLWKTLEGGRGWTKVGKLQTGILRVFFLDTKHGFAVGRQKAVLETTDGGVEWKPVAAAAEPKSREENSVYSWVEFVDGRNGLITGYSRPPRHEAELPDWVNPEKAVGRRQWPSLSLTLETHDAGKTWTTSTASIFGQITRVRLSSAGVGLGLIGFSDTFDWPAEVFRIDWRAGKSARVYREHNRRITDLAVLSDRLAYLSGNEVPGKLHQTPIPGKLKILRSTDFQTWTEMDVDYRASAAHTTLAAVDERNLWVATDTGMILKLVP